MKTRKQTLGFAQVGKNKKTIKKVDKVNRIPMSVPEKEEIDAGASVLEVKCPYCFSENFAKRGLRKTKKGKVQLYFCHDCLKTFTPGSVKGKHYPLPTILNAISLYNLGYSLEETCRIVNGLNSKS